ncbi:MULTISPECIES: tryptophan 2,3-dioxygenase family protein [Croceibacter]|jgi:tryptophan 2,3-dioxygenase|uniref:tryptophan 2,3-dioxygenase family protein n=1 Tax=Croceibacter TaxID=216431 RepID=UPI000C66B748|nr:MULTISPECIES: tryptophan 2,3-dioxygenase family protein [Croceibacter]MBG26074.1 tryptophan 2,3-dioxygenase [Croceibacter sp.]MBW4970154.1 tryptophan 2,3-dioxygenase [Croceibacter atlanticus]HAT70833.1 tryptophan 2,3-dioxygenase [Flavobacteriaceae bacterium]|tara:strand:+ start:5718 stop:6689 length:972 start_codon:yes stop_codon:yes gene_type:complete
MSNIDPEIAKKIIQLEKKFKNSGQDMGSYLDGLLHERYLTYWDYIHLDTLLSLQIPKTHFPDEEIFIGYHQITELYFKLIIHEQKQIIDDKGQKAEFFIEKITRINRYFRILIDSFDVMIRGMEREQFLKFRMSLLPASGFQSAQFRMIEVYATPLNNLVHPSLRKDLETSKDIENLYEQLYWKRGATDLKTKEKTLTLKQFEYRYTPRFIRIANEVKGQTIFHKYEELPESEKQNKKLIEALKNLDLNANVNWNLMHMGAAYRYLDKEGSAIQATGGTNWKQFLPPSFQKIVFFPSLWTEEELDNWGQEWVEHLFNTEKIKH